MLIDRMRNSSHPSRAAEPRPARQDDVDDELRRSVAAAAGSGLTVLISGKSAAGRSRIARLIHQRSSRAHLPLATINPGRMSSVAFATDLATLAPGGTLVIDHAARLSARLQDVLFRHLDGALLPQMPHQPLGARLIVAADQGLYAEMLAGRFRDDLFYRLNVIHLEILPLHRQRDAAVVDQFTPLAS